jgi:hypothetical protein
VDWIPFGFECVKMYSKFSKMPVFCHEQLIVKIAESIQDPVAALKYELSNQASKEGLTRF